jgi:hypothetical protein
LKKNTIFQAFLKNHQVVHRSVDGSKNGRENPTPTKTSCVTHNGLAINNLISTIDIV